MQKNYLLVILIFFLGVNVYSQKSCTPSLVVTKAQDRIYYEEYEYTLESSLDLHFNINEIFVEEDTEFSYYKLKLLYQLMLNLREKYGEGYSDRLFSVFKHSRDFCMEEIYEEGVDYLIELKYDNSKGRKNKRVLFRDGHRDYYQYIPLSADTVTRGRLAETYQKYGSVLVGTQTVYKYQKLESGVVERVVERSVNYDELYPVCWSTAIKMARRNGIKAKYPELIAPVGYPNKVLGNGEAYWVVKDGINEVKVDAYGGGMR